MKKILLAFALLVGTPMAHAVDLDQTYINFGFVNVFGGIAQTQFVTVTNTTDQPLGPLEVVSNCFAPDFTIGTGCDYQTLQSNQACQMMITFKPSRQGTFNCTIRIGAENAQGESDIQVTGQGI